MTFPTGYSARNRRRKRSTKNVEIPKQVGDEQGMLRDRPGTTGYFNRQIRLFYPEIQRHIHFVDWTYDDIKGKGWTHYRSVDYGWTNATACSFWAIGPAGEYFMYDEYYVVGREHRTRTGDNC